MKQLFLSLLMLSIAQASHLESSTEEDLSDDYSHRTHVTTQSEPFFNYQLTIDPAYVPNSGIFESLPARDHTNPIIIRRTTQTSKPDPVTLSDNDDSDYDDPTWTPPPRDRSINRGADRRLAKRQYLSDQRPIPMKKPPTLRTEEDELYRKIKANISIMRLSSTPSVHALTHVARELLNDSNVSTIAHQNNYSERTIKSYRKELIRVGILPRDFKVAQK